MSKLWKILCLNLNLAGMERPAHCCQGYNLITPNDLANVSPSLPLSLGVSVGLPHLVLQKLSAENKFPLSIGGFFLAILRLMQCQCLHQ